MTLFQMQALFVITMIFVLIGYRTGLLKRVWADRSQILGRLAHWRKRRQAGLAELSVEVAERTIWYVHGGKGPTTVLLLHGFTGDKDDWSDVASLLAKEGLRVVAPDLPGFGRNPKDPNRRYDPTTMTKIIRVFTRQVGLDRFHVVGHSVGAIVAAGYAYASPLEVQSLTLVEPFGIGVPYETELDKMIAKGRNPLLIGSSEEYDRLLSFLTVRAPELPSAVKLARGERRSSHQGFYAQIWKSLWEGERAKVLDLLLPEIKPPTMAIWGAKSRVVHTSTPEMARHLQPNIKNVVLRDCGHLPMIEKPEEVAKAILEQIRRAPS